MPSLFDHARIIFLPLHQANGAEQMDVDDAAFQALAAVPASEQLLLWVRCYTWTPATWSIGKLQKESSLLTQLTQGHPVVRRPTGGRAIFHDNDISFMFATNHPDLLRLSVKQSYCVFLDWLKQTLVALQVPLSSTCSESSAYQVSELCFDTHLPSELLSENGDKLCGMAQARQKGALLQHGAAFLAPWGISPKAFQVQLFKTIQQNCPNAIFNENEIDSVMNGYHPSEK